MSVSESMKQALEALTMGFTSERLSYISTHYRSGQDLRQLIRLEETQLCWAIFIEEFPTILEAMGVVDNHQEYTAPREIIRMMGYYPTQDDLELTGFLEWIAHECKFGLWCFGHFHEDWSMGKFRCLMNTFVVI